MKLRTLALGALLTVALAGCTAAPATSTPEPASTASSTPSPTPTSTVDPADPASWVIGFGSIGPLQVGGTIAEAGSALDSFTVTRQDACPTVPIIERDGYPHLVVPEIDGVINQLAVWIYPDAPETGLWRTTGGVALGSTQAELIGAYPDIVEVDGKYEAETYYSINDGSGNYINFDVNADGIVSSIVTRRDNDQIDGEYCG